MMDGIPWYKTPTAVMIGFLLAGLVLVMLKAPKFISMAAFIGAIACGIFGLLMIGTPEDEDEDGY